MEKWFFIIVSLCVAALLKALYDLVFPRNRLPPGPITVPFIGNFLWLRKSFSELESVLPDLHAKYGPIITLRMGSRPTIFISTKSLVHQALVQNGAVFADRPPAPLTHRVISCNQQNISAGVYGPNWRLFRRNLTYEILSPLRVKSYSRARKWVLDILLSRLQNHSGPIPVFDHFGYAMFCLLVLMCFGDKLGEKQIQEIEVVERKVLFSYARFNSLNFWGRLGKILFKKRWEELLQLRKDQEAVLIPLIKARQQLKQEMQGKQGQSEDYVLSYADTLLDLQLPEENRKLTYGEIVSLCSEFLNAATHSTSTTVQWIMANLVKYPHIQAKVYEEISGVVKDGAEMVREEDLQKMPYLKAVILEGLRRHPPGHFVLPHSVTQDTVLDGYLIPKNATVNFRVMEISLDPKIWEDPKEFRPERFLSSNGGGEREEAFDITGTREIKMMPFGAGRRVCPGYNLGLLHLEYYVANLVWKFEWKAVEGDDIDLSEKEEFAIMMKSPLQALISPRLK
ncbi:cytochrome P450 89A2 [Vitis vinifera]|uniref:cytochrome P450 89A2 n=1 Tax=Vitis vinifera TaxID=29760 RepID=UPI0001984E9F|nr:cytochrome P450 89A2 [Vitis vinifera]|eukprot:XP_010662054.1 PREDICTED: cytochrome P450 89A2-like [Vitis vinifera]